MQSVVMFIVMLATISQVLAELTTRYKMRLIKPFPSPNTPAMDAHLPFHIPTSATTAFSTLGITTHQVPAIACPNSAGTTYPTQPINTYQASTATIEPTPATIPFSTSTTTPFPALDAQPLLFDNHQMAAILSVYQALALSNNTTFIKITIAPGPWTPGINTVVGSIAIALNFIDMMTKWYC